MLKLANDHNEQCRRVEILLVTQKRSLQLVLYNATRRNAAYSQQNTKLHGDSSYTYVNAQACYQLATQHNSHSHA